MRKIVVLLASIALAALLACGVALAATVNCAGAGERCEGTEEDDRLHGSSDGEFITGGGGDDTIYARGGNDTVRDIKGRNRAYGGGGDDRLGVRGSAFGRAGGDLILLTSRGRARGGPGGDGIDAHNDRRNRVFCGTGRDKVYFDRGLDTLADGCERRIPREVPRRLIQGEEGGAL